MANFLNIATPFIQLGMPVFPLAPKTKIPPAGLHWDKEATTDPAKIEAWNKENADFNVGLAALSNGHICFLEFDVRQGMKKAAESMGEEPPVTRVQKSGSGYGHFIFTHTAKSRALGNRSVNLPDGHEWFSFRADTKYLVGAGSTHPNGKTYITMRDVEPIPMPDWLVDFVETNSMKAKAKARPQTVAEVSDEFDIEDFFDYYDITGKWDGEWFICDECPVAGHRHSQSVRTGFFYDGGTFGFHCFAQGCDGSQMSVGQVISYLNGKVGKPYKGKIWDGADVDEEMAEGKWQVDMLDDDDDEEPEPPASTIISSEDFDRLANEPLPAVDYAEGVAELAKELKWEGVIATSQDELAPAPKTIAINDPENHTGVEFPGDCAMYGKLAEIAKRSPALQMGWFYPALLGVASATGVEDASQNAWQVRSNMFVGLLGGVGAGKNLHMDAAKAALFVPGNDEVYVGVSPNSHGGLMHMLSPDAPVRRLLFLDELIGVMNACAIQGSNLTSMLCSLWNKDEAGGSVRASYQKVYGDLSILGGLAVNDPADFSRVFGSASTKGLYDRFLFGYSSVPVKFNRRSMPTRAEVVEVKPVHFAEWVYDAKNDWVGEDLTRGRMSEHALRIAMVTAAINGDMEVTPACLEAAFRYMEWQERLREVFKPGVAETKEAECYEAVYSALRQRYDRQRDNNEIPKGAAELTIALPVEDRWKLINFRQVVNSKSYYRKYATLIERVKNSMVENEVIREVRSEESDGEGKLRKVKTKFIVIASDLK